MDPVTHVLLGASVAQLALGRKLGWSAAAVGAVAGLVPDADAFIRSPDDPLLEIEYHRHFTHALLFAPVGALVATLPWVLRASWRYRWREFWIAALLAYFSHCLLDASTTYGTQLYWPFSNHRAGWNLISIIDPFFTLALAAGLLVGRLKRRQRFVKWAVAFCLCYLVLGGAQHYRAGRAQVKLAESRGHQIEGATVMPTLGNNLVWRSLYLEDGRIHSDRIRVGWLSGATFFEGASLPRMTKESLTAEEARLNERTRAFERFAWFADDWVARSPFDESVLGDMRYSLSMEAFDPIWGIRFAPSGKNGVVEWVSRTRDRKLRLDELWAEIRGTHPDYRPVSSAGAAGN